MLSSPRNIVAVETLHYIRYKFIKLTEIGSYVNEIQQLTTFLSCERTDEISLPIILVCGSTMKAELHGLR